MRVCVHFTTIGSDLEMLVNSKQKQTIKNWKTWPEAISYSIIAEDSRRMTLSLLPHPSQPEHSKHLGWCHHVSQESVFDSSTIVDSA